MKRLDQLTFTRFVAILIVIFFHGGGGAYLRALNIFLPSSLLVSATASVTYLYVLSGFVMSLVYYRPEEKFSIMKYWTSRIVRLYPLYIISFLLVCLYYFDVIARIKTLKILANIFVLQAWWPPYAQSFNYAAWSMTVEFFFYAIFPFLTMWSYRQATRKLISISIIFWAVSQSIHNFLWAGYYPQSANFLIYFPLFHLSSFVLGVVGGVWFIREGQGGILRPGITLTVFLGSLLLVSVYIIESSRFTQLPNNLELMTGLLAPFLVIIIISLALDQGRLSLGFNKPTLINLGETSYALYILHVPFIWIYQLALEKITPANHQSVFDYTFLPLMIGLGLLINNYVDVPLRKWLKRLLEKVSIPLLVLDLGIIGLSVYLSFHLRFPSSAEYESYSSTALIMFWCAFLLRTILSVLLGTLNPAHLQGTVFQVIRPILVSVSVGSVFIAALIFIGYRVGWLGNYPRSIFVLDWFLVLFISACVRFIFRSFEQSRQVKYSPTIT